jgi:PiT family inorganic phosphate transporter
VRGRGPHGRTHCFRKLISPPRAEGFSTVFSVIFIIAIALIFDYLNGFHDAANSVATIVATRVLSPQSAVIWAAFFNFIAFLFFGLSVANTVGKGIIVPGVVDSSVVFAALLSAILWNIASWHFGIPASSSHALIGGLGGASFAKAGIGSLEISGFAKIGLSIFLSPLLGFVLALILMVIVSLICIRSSPKKVDGWFRRGQLISASLYSLGHGGNDAQKTMGIIAVLLFSAGLLGKEFQVPLWVVLSCHLAMALGTLSGGWRIVRTMGMRITELKPVGGFCAETAGALTLFLATGLGIPVSTTHTITGSIIGVGAMNQISSVRWRVAVNIVWAWVLTLPLAAVVGALIFKLSQIGLSF